MSPLSPQDLLQLAHFTLDHADEAAFCADAQGQFLYLNEAACRALAFPRSELQAMTLFQAAPDLTPELWAQLWKEIKAQEMFAFEFSLLTKDNRSLPVEITARRMTLAGQDILCAFFRDVNERQKLQQLKNEFVSTVSHELRTPMTIIRESVSQLLDGLLGDVPPAQREALYLTLAGIDRLARIINDLLDISKMEAGKAALKWERLNLADLIREVLETFAARAKERGLELYAALPAAPITLYADYDRLAQVFTNLVGNALKFSEKGKVQITVNERDSEVECVVCDTGFGIAQEDLGRIFNKFEQLGRPAVSGEKGSGLGLSICKGVVELHQGRIWAESQPRKGSSFIFVLPKKTAEDLFRQKMSAELALAGPRGGHVSALVFRISARKNSDPRREATLAGWAVEELLEAVLTHGARKTDIILKDAAAVWLGLLNMNKKEAERVAQRILEGCAAALQKNELAESIEASVRCCSFPEDVKNEKDLIQHLKEGPPHAA